ncbi:MAG: potassium-transporting ATPase subunit KdpA [Bryobacteraceae bacterium]|jgi:K+-transporting ATPase ATPase A chain
MTWTTLAQLVVFLAALAAITKPLGAYMAKVFSGERTFLSRVLAPMERAIYRMSGIDPAMEQTWTSYAAATLLFGLVNFVLFYALLRLQGFLPWNPSQFGTAHAPAGSVPVTPDLAFNTAVSFMTNTSWQSYPGETTLGYCAQMAGVAVQSFTSGAVGLAVAVALIRAFVSERTGYRGNFWVDLTRSTLYVLLPLSLVGALFLCSQGVVQTLAPYRDITTIEGAKQAIPMGPVASQESIKLLSSDGGGYFNANSAHPFENPAPLTNLVEMLLMLAIPAGITYTFGRMVNDQRQGWTLFAVMFVLFGSGAVMATLGEQAGNPILRAAGINAKPGGGQPGGNMEGKEARFGIGGSALFSVTSTASSDGAVNSSHDSFTPLGGLVQLFNLTTGEVIFGGVGTGIVSMIFMVLVTVFIAGLLVGRTPEYLGKRIETKEMKMVMLSIVATGAATLLFAGATFLVAFPKAGYWNAAGALTENLTNRGAHGLSEVIYANASAVATNGSAFAGLNANTPWYNLTLGIEMLIGRFLVIIPALAVAGSLARKRRLAITGGTIPTHGPLFAGLLLGAIVLVTALTFFPALSLGPIAEHYLMHLGTTVP